MNFPREIEERLINELLTARRRLNNHLKIMLISSTLFCQLMAVMILNNILTHHYIQAIIPSNRPGYMDQQFLICLEKAINLNAQTTK